MEPEMSPAMNGTWGASRRRFSQGQVHSSGGEWGEKERRLTGVRISCDILARNSDLVLFANSAASLAAVLR